jgi:hypothetical protein
MNRSLIGKYLLVCEDHYCANWAPSGSTNGWDGLNYRIVMAYKIAGYYGRNTALCQPLWRTGLRHIPAIGKFKVVELKGDLMGYAKGVGEMEGCLEMVVIKPEHLSAGYQLAGPGMTVTKTSFFASPPSPLPVQESFLELFEGELDTEPAK